MKVTVVGSYRKNQKLLGNVNMFRTACKAIGRKLAEWKHELVVPHADDDQTAETHALAGFVAAGSNHYYQCIFHPGDPALKAHFEAVERSDAVVLLGGLNGTYAAGLGALRHRKLIIPIPVFGGSAKDLCEIPDIDQMLVDDIRNLSLGAPDWTQRLTNSLSSVLSAYPRVLIIHGRGDAGTELREQVERASLEKGSRLKGLATPVIMNLQGKGALSVPDVFEGLASKVSAAIAIVTADDVGGFARADTPDRKDYSARDLRLTPRARENVWVEVGWFWGRLGRHRVLLWLKEGIELPTDLQGAAWTKGDLEQAWGSIEAFLTNLRRAG
jgi:hypothetical protein